ncbi:hypothetical protein PMAYCL1PPCAC_04177, partial [Pristionchus mayeri]
VKMSGFKQQTPVSQLIRTGKGGGGVDERKTRDSFRREKDLEEDRKLGLEPACVDVDSGRDINPHIPQFITQTPWYVPAEGPTLKHQRPHWERQQEVDTGVHEWYHRGVKETSSKPVKFKAGSCENCGATTHKKKECYERPRKLGAKHTNDDIAADDYLQPKIRLTSWEAKRDRWNGYDNAAYSEVIKEHEKQEEVRKIIKAEKLKEEKAAADAAKEKAEAENSADEGAAEEKEGGAESQGDEIDDEDKYADDADMQQSVDMDSRTRITVRNLRIREDTAKYLYNLNENAPYYDPKSRSMRENPLAGIKGKEAQAAKFAGENFVRYSGEVVAANEAQVFAWSARCQGIDVHALAEPTKLEQLQKDFKSEKKDVKEETKQKLLEKYGGDEHLQAPPKELLMAQSEAYVEYSRKGAIIKGEERPLVKSRYEEDVYAKNHSSVFGSFWANGRWGFRCCHSFVKQSYCIGEQGYAVNDEMAALPTMTKKEAKEEPKEEKKEEVEEVETKKEVKEESSSSSSSESESSEDSEEEREKQKKKKEEEAEEEKRRAEREARKRDRRREKRKRRAEKMGGKRKRKRHNSSSSSDDSGDSSASEKEEDNTEDAKLQREVAKALKEDQRARKEAKKNERDRKYNTNYDFKKPTEVEVEAYKLTQVHAADPMAKYIEEKRNK